MKTLIAILALVLPAADPSPATQPANKYADEVVFEAMFISLIHESIADQDATITIAQRTKWHWQRMGETMRYWRLLYFHLKPSSPDCKAPENDYYLVFAWEPIEDKAEIYSPGEAGELVHEGMQTSSI